MRCGLDEADPRRRRGEKTIGCRFAWKAAPLEGRPLCLVTDTTAPRDEVPQSSVRYAAVRELGGDRRGTRGSLRRRFSTYSQRRYAIRRSSTPGDRRVRSTLSGSDRSRHAGAVKSTAESVCLSCELCFRMHDGTAGSRTKHQFGVNRLRRGEPSWPHQPAPTDGSPRGQMRTDENECGTTADRAPRPGPVLDAGRVRRARRDEYGDGARARRAPRPVRGSKSARRGRWAGRWRTAHGPADGGPDRSEAPTGGSLDRRRAPG